jgi:hypothetical protein
MYAADVNGRTKGNATDAAGADRCKSFRGLYQFSLVPPTAFSFDEVNQQPAEVRIQSSWVCARSPKSPAKEDHAMTRLKMLWPLLIALLLASVGLSADYAFGQATNTGTVVGVVEDQSGAVPSP